MTKVIVIGAGLAGLYAAWSAALNGADVYLYEKDKIGTKYNCGELYTEVYMSAPEECKLNQITKFRMYAGSSFTDIDFGELSPFVMTDKRAHEQIIKRKCENLGVNIFEGSKVSYVDFIDDSKVIIATGVNLKDMSISKGKAVDYEYIDNGVISEDWYEENKHIARFFIRDDMMGYSWSFPKSRYVSNVGEGVYDYKYNCKLFRPSDSNILHKGGGILPMPTMDQYYNKIKNEERILVGNAAGLINSCLGGGEHLAVISGMLAGELCAKDKEDKYWVALDEIIGDEMRFGISLYEFLRKLDINTVSNILTKRFKEQIDYLTMNKHLRKAMGNWIHIPEVGESELSEFIK